MSLKIESVALELREMVTAVVKNNPAQGIFFSGGLDTSVLAAIDPGMQAVTVSFESKGEDINYSRKVADYLAMKQFIRRVNSDEALEVIPEVIKILRSFDPAIPNDLVVYFAMKYFKELGVTKIMAGDGSDEIFGGYSYMRDMIDLESYIERISTNMRFSSNVIGEYFGIDIIQPFMNEDVVKFARRIARDLKINEHQGKVHGKWILRKAFEGMLPDEIIWQSKRPLERGSAMAQLRDIIQEKVSPEEFENNPYGINFINREHIYYYKVYKDVVGAIPVARQDEEKCPGCGAGMEPGRGHCYVCGYC